MNSKVALVQYDKCKPENCKDGICSAAMACPRKLLKQESPKEIPMPHPSMCKGCGDCMRACPNGAITIVAM